MRNENMKSISERLTIKQFKAYEEKIEDTIQEIRDALDLQS